MWWWQILGVELPCLLDFLDKIKRNIPEQREDTIKVLVKISGEKITRFLHRQIQGIYLYALNGL